MRVILRRAKEVEFLVLGSQTGLSLSVRMKRRLELAGKTTFQDLVSDMTYGALIFFGPDYHFFTTRMTL